MVISMRPWPGISVLPVQVPTRDFIRSNSGEFLRALSGSAAFKPTVPASSNIAQTEVILVFIVFLSFLGCFFVICFELHLYNERETPFRTIVFSFFWFCSAVRDRI